MTDPVPKIDTDTLEKAATTAGQRLDEATKVLDRSAVKLELRVACTVDEVAFTPPFRIRVNGLAVPGELDGSSPVTVWWDTPVRTRGPDPIEVVLEPVDGAEEFFRSSRSGKKRYLGAYSRNDREAAGAVYSVPPAEEADGERDYPAHVVRLALRPRRKWLVARRGADEMPQRWRSAAAPEG